VMEQTRDRAHSRVLQLNESPVRPGPVERVVRRCPLPKQRIANGICADLRKQFEITVAVA
jgi:hypothetical protein